MHEFFHRLKDNDRVLLVGDTRQHQAVEAGTPYQQLQETGIQTVRLDAIVRQQDPALKEAVEHLSRGDIAGSSREARTQGRVHEIPARDERLRAIAREFAKDPQETLVVSPDNRSRREINQSIHRHLQTRGQVDHDEQRLRVLVARQEVTGADRQWAEQYAAPAMSCATRREARRIGSSRRVCARRASEREGESGDRRNRERRAAELRSAPPARRDAVPRGRAGVMREGDSVQFTAPDREQQVANRELGTIEKIDARAATSKCASTQAAPSHSTSKRIRISTTATR